MYRYTYIIIVLILIISLPGIKAQDPVFTQFYVNKLYLNPAFAGSSNDARFLLDYRNYWPNLSNTFVHYNVSYDQPSALIHGGFGLNIMNDKQGQGTLNKLLIDGIYAYQVKINRFSNLRAGFQTSFIQHKMDVSDVILPDMYDYDNMGFINSSQESLYNEKASNIDFSAGLLFDFRVRHQYYYIGLASHHLTAPLIVFNGSKKVLARKYTIHFGTLFPVFYDRFGKEKVFLSPLLLYQRQADYEQLHYKCNILVDSYKAGVGIRQNLMFNINSVTLSLGITREYFDIVYSYDQGIYNRRYNYFNLMAHEVTFLLKFKYNGSRNKKKAIKYPEF